MGLGWEGGSCEALEQQVQALVQLDCKRQVQGWVKELVALVAGKGLEEGVVQVDGRHQVRGGEVLELVVEGEQVQPEQVSADMCQSQEQVQVRGGLQVQVLAEELVEQVAGTGLEEGVGRVEAPGRDGGALLVQASLACGLQSQRRA